VPASRGPVRTENPRRTEAECATLIRAPQRCPRRTEVPRTPAIRPLTALGEAGVSDADVTVRTVGTIRVTSARQDFTGQRELAWVADEGEQVGDARCSRTFRLSRDAAAEVRPTLLICWHVNENKSVYTVVIDRRNQPSKKTSRRRRRASA
jgi:hypothetical protein